MTTFPSGTWTPDRLRLNQTERRKESALRHVAWWVTHRYTPGTSTVGFVKAWEAFTANETGVCHQVSSTEEHWPERKHEDDINHGIAQLVSGEEIES